MGGVAGDVKGDEGGLTAGLLVATGVPVTAGVGVFAGLLVATGEEPDGHRLQVAAQ